MKSDFEKFLLTGSLGSSCQITQTNTLILRMCSALPQIRYFFDHWKLKVSGSSESALIIQDIKAKNHTVHVRCCYTIQAAIANVSSTVITRVHLTVLCTKRIYASATCEGRIISSINRRCVCTSRPRIRRRWCRQKSRLQFRLTLYVRTYSFCFCSSSFAFSGKTFCAFF